MIAINRIIEGIHSETAKLYTELLEYLGEIRLSRNNIYKIFENLRNSKQENELIEKGFREARDTWKFQ